VRPASAPAGPRRIVGSEVRVLLRTVVAVALVLLVVNVATRAYLLAEIAPRVDHLRTAAEDLDSLHAGMVDEETGARGYLATGSPVFLDPYNRALPVVAAASTTLSTSVPAGRLTRDLVNLEQARQRWTDQWADKVTAAESRRDLTTFLLQGKSLFDAYRRTHDALRRDIEAQISSATRLQNAWLLWSGLVQAAITLGVVTVSLLARRRITRRITQPVEALATTVGRITDGDMDARVTLSEGPAELVALGRDIDAMSDALAEQMTLAKLREDEATRHGQRLSTVLAAAREVAGSLSLRYVMSSVATAACNLGSDRVRIWLLDDEDENLVLSFDTAAGPNGPAQLISIAAGTGVVGRAAHFGHPVGPEPLEDGGSTVAVPLIVGGRVVGALECQSVGEAAGTAELEVLEALAGHAAGAVVSARLHEQTLEFAVTDALTRLPNRRAFENEFDDEVQRAQRYHRPLSVISVDLDHFKLLNDRYGHAYGDLALQQCSDALRHGIRTTDRIYRLGGEEIAIVCPETTAADARILAERLRVAVETSAGPDAPPVTASFGIAELPSHAGDAKSLLAAADRALYAAKSQGRNRVEIDQSTVVSQYAG
jgi:diguanylate cyclase (GGDEF)-like protein